MVGEGPGTEDEGMGRNTEATLEDLVLEYTSNEETAESWLEIRGRFLHLKEDGFIIVFYFVLFYKEYFSQKDLRLCCSNQ